MTDVITHHANDRTSHCSFLKFHEITQNVKIPWQRASSKFRGTRIIVGSSQNVCTYVITIMIKVIMSSTTTPDVGDRGNLGFYTADASL